MAVCLYPMQAEPAFLLIASGCNKKSRKPREAGWVMHSCRKSVTAQHGAFRMLSIKKHGICP